MYHTSRIFILRLNNGSKRNCLLLQYQGVLIAAWVVILFCKSQGGVDQGLLKLDNTDSERFSLCLLLEPRFRSSSASNIDRYYWLYQRCFGLVVSVVAMQLSTTSSIVGSNALHGTTLCINHKLLFWI